MELVDRDAVLRGLSVLLCALRPGARFGGDGDGDDLLCEDVEGVARHHGGLDQPFVHATHHDGALEEIAAELGEDPPHAHLPHAVAGPPDPLQAAGDGLGGLDLQHQVDGAHVDAELQGAGGDEAGQLPALQQLLDLRALLSREGAVVGAGDLEAGAAPLGSSLLRGGLILRRQLVQPQRHPLGRPAVVDEDDRGGVLAHLPEQLRVDGGPDGVARGLPAGERLQGVGHLSPRPHRRRAAWFGHRLDGDFDTQIELLGGAGVDEVHATGGTDEVTTDLLQRALGGAQADALDLFTGRAAGSAAEAARDLCVEALECKRQVGATLGVGDGVDLIHDHGLDDAERLPCA
jgi:hypothetical protein